MIGRIATIVTRFAVAGVARTRAAIASISAAARRAGIGPAFSRIGRQAAAAIRGLDRMGISARNTGRVITAAMRGAARAIGSVASAAKKLVFNKYSAIGGAAYGAGALALKSLGPLGTLAGGFGAAGLAVAAGAWTMPQVTEIKQAMSSLMIGPELASQWQDFAKSAGLELDDVVGSMQTLGKSVLESLDPTSDAAKMWKTLGISTRGANGRLKNSSDLMFELAGRMQKLDAGGKAIVLSSVFGESEAGKLGPLFEKLGKDRDALIKAFEEKRKNGLFVSQAQIDAYDKFGVALSGALEVLRAFARELFVAFIPTFNSFLKAFTDNFKDPQKRAKAIEEWFVQPFWRAFRLIREIIKVFTGIDFVTAIFGGQTDLRIQNTWLLDLKWWLVSIWNTALGLISIFQGFGRALLDVAGYVDRIVAGMTGFSISDWLTSAGSTDFRAFGRDIRQVLDELFDKPVDFSKLETSFGRGIGEFVNFIQRQVGPTLSNLFGTSIQGAIAIAAGVISQFRKAMADIDQATASGKGLSGLTTTFGRLLYIVGKAAGWVADLATNLQKVFVLGQGADAGFGWLESIRKWLVDNDVIGKLSTLIAALPGVFERIAGILERIGPAVEKAAGIAGTAGGFVVDRLTDKRDAGQQLGDGLAWIGGKVWNSVKDSVVEAFTNPFPGFETEQMRRAFATDYVDDLRSAGTTAEADRVLRQFGTPEQKPAPIERTPVQINVEGLSQPLSAAMTPSELDEARAMQMRRTSQ